MLRKIVITLVGTAALGSVFITTGASAESSHRYHPRHLWNYSGSALGKAV
jgi:hypothetical protein